LALLASVGVIMYLAGDRLRVTVDDEEIARHNVFKTRTFLLKEIDGYRTGPDTPSPGIPAF